MLDKELCEIFGIDEFTQWLMKELDEAEEELSNKGQLVATTSILRYQFLKEVRDEYCKYLKKNKRK